MSKYIGQDPLLAEVRIPVYNDFDKVKAELGPSQDSGDELSDDLIVKVDVDVDDGGLGNVNVTVTDKDGLPVEADLSLTRNLSGAVI